MNAQLVTWIGELPAWSVRLLFGLSIVWTAAGIAVWFLRRGSAAVRHRTWGLSVVAALVLPLLVWCLPEVRLGWFEAPSGRSEIGSGAVAVVENESARTSMDRVEQPTPDGRPDRTRDGESASAPSIEFVSRTEIPTTESPIIELKSLQLTPSQTEPTSAASSNPLAFAGIGGWWLIALCAPAFWGLFQILRSLRVAGRIVARSEEITDPICRQLLAGVAGVQAAGVQASACANGGSQNKLHPSLVSRGEPDIASRPQNREIAASVGLRSLKAELQRLQLRQSADTPVPLCVGLRKSSIILPADWRTWTNETLRAALAHELSHVVRRDVAWQLLARLACALYWFHPLAWVAARRMRIEREEACDDGAIRAGTQPAAYARALVAVAERLHGHRPVAAAAAMATRSELERRVRAILAANRSRLPVRRSAGRALALAALVVGLFAAVLSPFSSDPFAQRAVAQGTDRKETSPSVPAAPEAGQPGVVVGEVVEGDGTPVSGVLVLLRDRNLFQATTDEKGRFRFEKIPHGHFTLWAHKDDLASPQERIVGKETAGQETGTFAPIRLTMKPGREVHFTVVSGVTKQPIEGADIRFGFPDRRQKSTDKAGLAVERALRPAKYEVWVDAPGHARARREIDLTDVETSLAQTFTLAAGGVAHGTVTDEAGKPLPRARVGFRVSGVGYGDYGTSPYADDEGKFRNPYLPLGTPVEVTVSLDDYEPVRSQIALSAAVPELKVDIVLMRRPPGGSIAGIVTDAGGKPIAGARVINGGDGRPKRETTADAEGRFVLHDLVERLRGKEIVVRAPKFAPILRKVDVGTEEAPGKVAVILESGHTLRGRLVSSTGTPIKAAFVAANGFGDDGIGATVRTSDDGAFEFDSLPAESKFEFSAAGHPHVFGMKLELDGREPVVVTLEPHVVLEGRVVDADTGEPIAEYRMQGGFSRDRRPADAAGSYPNGLSNGMTVQSKEGVFRVNEMTKGVPVELSFDAEGYERAVFPRVVAGTSESEAVAKVALKKRDAAKSTSLAGKIIDGQTKGIPGVQIRLIVTSEPTNGSDDNRFPWGTIESGELGRRSHVDQFFSTVSDAEGKFEFPNLLPGKFLQLAYWGKSVPKSRSLALGKTKPGEGQSTIIRVPAPAEVRGTIDRAIFPKIYEIQLEREDRDILVYHAKLKDGESEFRFENLAPGPFRITVGAPLERAKDNPNMFSSRSPLAQKKLQIEPGKSHEVNFAADDLIREK